MTIGVFGYHNVFGFGKVIETKEGYLTLYFSNIGEKTVANSYISFINPRLAKYFIERKYEHLNYNWGVVSRGQQYYYSHAITSVSYSNDRFIATVSGSEDYHLEVFISPSNAVRVSCNCPYNGMCKHNYALMLYLANLFEKLNDYQKEGNFIDLSEQMKGAISSYVNSHESFSSNLSIMLDELIQNINVAYLTKFLNYLDRSYRYRSDLNTLIEYLSLNEELAKFFDEKRNEICDGEYSRAISNALMIKRKIKENLTSIYINDRYPVYYFMNQDYKECLIRALETGDYFFRYDSLLVIAAQRVEVDERIFKALQKYLQKNSVIHSEGVNKLIDKLPINMKMEIYQDPKNRIFPEFNDIKDFPHEECIQLLTVVEYDESAVRDIINLLDYQNDDPSLIARVLNNLVNQCNNQQLLSEIIERAKRLPNSKYLVMYFNQIALMAKQKYYYSNDKGSFMRFNLIDQKVEKESFCKYFDFEYQIDDYGEGYALIYKLNDLTNTSIIEVKDLTSGTLKTLKNNLDGVFDSIYVQYVCDHVSELFENEIQQDVKEIKAEIQQRQEKRKQDVLLQSLQDFNTNLPAKYVSLVNKRKAHLEYFFMMNDHQVYLQFKVGIDKSYIVKNAYNFLENFTTEQTVSYGKGLELTHKVDNFIEKDKKVLSLLIGYDFSSSRSYYGDAREILIKPNLLHQIFEILKGSQVYVNQKMYTLTLNDMVPNITIDENYVINADFAKEGLSLVSIGNYLYLLNDKKQRVDKINCNLRDKAFYEFINKNIGTSVLPLLEQFKQTVFSKYSEKFTVDSAVKNQFKVSEMLVKSYFDYSDKTITVDTDYIIDDQKVDQQNITNPDDLQKLSIYNEYITSLGFNDGKMTYDADILNFFSMDLSDLKSLSHVYLSEAIQNKQLVSFSAGTIRIQYENNMMQAFLEDSEYSDEELEKIIKAIRRKKKFIQLSGNRIIDLSKEDAQQFQQAVDELKLNEKKLKQSTEISLTDALKGFAYQKQCSVDDYLSKMIEEIKNFKNYDVQLPEINGELRNYQMDGFRWMSVLSKYQMGGILADDMGLGKTLEVITLLASSQVNKPKLIVCPKSLVFNWKNEINRFTPYQKAVEIYGSKQERSELINSIIENDKTIYITSYDSLRLDFEEYNQSFNYLIIDEAQYIKNVNAQKTLTVKQIKADHKLALTGTPIENNVLDLWSIFDFIMPGYFEDISTFKGKYLGDENFTERISKRIAPFILRRTKENVLKDLPEKFERILSAEMTQPQKLVYDGYRKTARDLIEKGSASFDILPYLTRLRQICVDPSTFIENYEGESGKMLMLDKILDEYLENGHRILIFSQFVKALEQIEKMLKRKKIHYYMITGNTTSKKRIEITESFNNHSKQNVVLISLKAGGTGLNLIGADTVIHLDPWWNVSAENQATDRTHRIGQTKNVEVIKLICENSIEQRVIELQNMKKDLIDQLISNDENSVSSASLEDIKFILE